ncbi:MAG: tRNA (cytidine(34)-2'-O)-methyltransferase [Spirochaetia bacterium]|nr:tRNA (cytidine(34)-2'-O)-methyltransferase [Spirochaetia bacterium]
MRNINDNKNTKELITLALYKPQIPPNTGNISRLCVGVNVPLLIVGKPAFSLDEASLKRAGLDHWPLLKFNYYDKYKNFIKDYEKNRLVMITKEGKEILWDFEFNKGDVLILGNETKGLPPKMIKLAHKTVKIPMTKNIRSLNLSNAAAVCVYESLRQFSKSDPTVGLLEEMQNNQHQRTYYKKSANFTQSE